MGAFILKHLLTLVAVWFGIITLIFLVRVVVPGDPVDTLLFGQPRTPEVVANMRKEMGLDKSLPEQYVSYIVNALQGDFGKSLTTRRPVLQEIGDRYIRTLGLALSSLTVGLTLGLVFGTVAAKFKDSFIDTAVTALSLVGLSLPSIWLGLILINFLGVQLGWLPVVGQGDFVHLIMPTLTLGIIDGAVLARFVRSSLLEVLGQDYIRTATSKGLSQTRVLTSHAFKNAMIPVVTVCGLQFGALLGGAVIVENIFAWPGLGQLAVRSISQRDYPVVQGIVLLAATTYLIVNTIVDIMYGVLNPQIIKR